MCDCNPNVEYNYTHIEDETCAYTVSPTQEEVCCKLTETLEVEGRLIVCIFGLIFNTLSILLLLDKNLSGELFHRLLLCLVLLRICLITLLLIRLHHHFISGEIFNRLLLCLAIMDNVYLVIGIIEVYFHVLEVPSMREMYVYFWFLYPARGITMCSIIYITILLAAQRYRSVAKPLSMRNPHLSGASWLKVMAFVGFVILISSTNKCFG